MKTILFSLVLVALAVDPASAESIPPVDDVRVRLGGYLTQFDTEIRADGTTEAGTPIDLENDFDLGEEDFVVFAGAEWTPWERHTFSLGYFQDQQSNSRVLTREIQFRDQLFETTSEVSAKFEIESTDIGYTYWAFLGEDSAFGIRAGLAAYRLSLDLDAVLEADGTEASEERRAEAKTDLPIPTIGVDWRWTPGDQWRLYANAGYLEGDTGDYDASMFSYRLGVEYFPAPSIGIWLDVGENDISANVSRPRFNGDLDLAEGGVRAGLSWRFGE